MILGLSPQMKIAFLTVEWKLQYSPFGFKFSKIFNLNEGAECFVTGWSSWNKSGTGCEIRPKAVKTTYINGNTCHFLLPNLADLQTVLCSKNNINTGSEDNDVGAPLLCQSQGYYCIYGILDRVVLTNVQQHIGIYQNVINS